LLEAEHVLALSPSFNDLTKFYELNGLSDVRYCAGVHRASAKKVTEKFISRLLRQRIDRAYLEWTRRLTKQERKKTGRRNARAGSIERGLRRLARGAAWP
jgi:hypothetical protein